MIVLAIDSSTSMLSVALVAVDVHPVHSGQTANAAKTEPVANTVTYLDTQKIPDNSLAGSVLSQERTEQLLSNAQTHKETIINAPDENPEVVKNVHTQPDFARDAHSALAKESGLPTDVHKSRPLRSLRRGVIAEATADSKLRHAENLMPMIDFCLEKGRCSRSEIGLVACAKGPGSFTGLRVGMATAKGISLGLGIPFVSVPTLDIFGLDKAYFPGIVMPVLYESKARVFAAEYSRGKRIGPWLDIALENLFTILDTHIEVLATGPDADLLEEHALERSGLHIDRELGCSTARMLCWLAVEQWRNAGPDSDSSAPLYMRPSDARSREIERS